MVWFANDDFGMDQWPLEEFNVLQGITIDFEGLQHGVNFPLRLVMVEETACLFGFWNEEADFIGSQRLVITQ